MNSYVGGYDNVYFYIYTMMDIPYTCAYAAVNRPVCGCVRVCDYRWNNLKNIQGNFILKNSKKK